MFNYGVTHFDAYVDFLMVVLGGAPDRWAREDFLDDADQLDLDRAFTLLREKLPLVEARVVRADAAPKIRALLEETYDAYVAGDEARGAALIQDFEAMIFASTRLP